MSTIELKTTPGIFSSKNKNCLAFHRHGSTGWREGETGEWEKMIYCVDKNSGKGIWLIERSYAVEMKRRKDANRNYYNLNPLLLRRKIEEKKKKNRDLLHSYWI